MKRVVVGLLLGVTAVVSPGWMFICLLAAGIGWRLARTAARPDRRFLARLFLAGFAVRALLSIGLDLGSWVAEKELPSLKGPAQAWDLGVRDYTRRYLRMGDSDYYSDRGWALAEYLRGSREEVVIFRLNQYGWSGYVDLIGFFYGLFGFSPSAVKGINCLLGAGVGILVFLLTVRMFERRVARWAAGATTFFPSLVLWSATNLKEIPFIFLTLLSILLFIRLLESQRLLQRVCNLLGLAVALLLHASIREVFFLVLIVALLAAAALRRWEGRAGMLALGGAGAGLVFLYGHPPAMLWMKSLLAQIFHRHIGYTTTPGISYFLFPPYFYQPNYVFEWAASGPLNGIIGLAILKAFFHFFLEPLPGRLDTFLHLPVLFQMILWYGILALAAGGLGIALRGGRGQTLFLLFPLLTFSSLIALTNGNVGTLFRVRDLVTPLILIYASAGLQPFLAPKVVEGSRLIAWGRRRTRPPLPQAEGWGEGGRWGKISQGLRRLAAWFRSFRVREASQVLLIALLANTLLLTFRGIEWTGWSAAVRLGLLGAGLWGWNVRSDWTHLSETSWLMRRGDVRLS